MDKRQAAFAAYNQAWARHGADHPTTRAARAALEVFHTRDALNKAAREANRASRYANETAPRDELLQAHRTALGLSRTAAREHRAAGPEHARTAAKFENLSEQHARTVGALERAHSPAPAPASLAPGGPVPRDASGPGEASSSDS